MSLLRVSGSFEPFVQGSKPLSEVPYEVLIWNISVKFMTLYVTYLQILLQNVFVVVHQMMFL